MSTTPSATTPSAATPIDATPITGRPRLAHPEIAWAARRMPLLADTFDAVGSAFAGLRLGVTIHVEPKTAVLCQYLVHAGAEVVITGNVGTTQQPTVDALRAAGVEVLGSRADTAVERDAHLDEILRREPQLVLDNGGDLILKLTAGAPRSPGFRGATEETTTGGLRIRSAEEQPDFPVIVINDSRLKLLVENEFGVGQSIVQGFMNATNLMLPGARAGVVGYGPCGKGVADTLRQLGATVTVADLDPFRQLDALMRGHQVRPLNELLAENDLVFLATGARGVVDERGIAALRDGAIVAGVGHEGLELDHEAFARATRETVALSPAAGDADARVLHRLHDGREIVVLHTTRMINLTAAGGNPIQAMDLGLALQARSLAAIAAGETAFTGAEPVPDAVDRVLAESLVRLLA
ncbi:adenosylhomocysteinase [Leifsonia aquatica]|uniref:adenosylhomocysteinase n=1 Tax=Leifsonia aquatica TaxID=144185 RepID=UPI00046AFB02|nr:adenosylhomocysteinase [Leifsonia aquatica]